MNDKYVVFKSSRNNKWYFRRLSGNNEVVAASEAYNKKESAVKEAHRQADPENLTVTTMEG